MNWTFSTIKGVSISSSSLFKISESNLWSTFLNFFLGKSLIWQGISFQSFTPKRDKEFLCIYSRNVVVQLCYWVVWIQTNLDSSLLKKIHLSYFADVVGPVFSNCSQNIIANADRGNTSTSVTWTPPRATDNSGVDPDIVHVGKGPGDLFSAGEHSIRYRASDKRGNVGECNFKIIVAGNVLR